MNGDSAALSLKMGFTGLHELGNDFFGWSGAIGKNHVIVSDALLLKSSFIILWIVQPYNSTHVQMLEYFGVTGS